MIEYLTVRDVVEIHEIAIEIYGGRHGIHSCAGLESSVYSPQSSYGGKLLLGTYAEVASAYCHYIATGHVFTDGNKRTGLMSAIGFLSVNGYEIKITQGWIDLMVKVGDGRVTREDLAQYFACTMGAWGNIE